MSEMMNIPLHIDGTQDLDTRLLLARLALQDLEEIESSRKGKERLGSPLSDERQAFKLQEEYLQNTIQFLTDLKLARSLDLALGNDAELLHLAAQEQAAVDDRRAAIALSNGEVIPPITLAQRALDTENPSTPTAPNPVHVSSASNGTSDEAINSKALTGTRNDASSMSSTRTPGPSVNRSSERVECIICYENYLKMHCFTAPCEHHYCRNCIKNLVEAYLGDESLYPVRCCNTPMGAESVVAFIPISLQQRFLAKTQEYETTAPNRVYCHNGACSRFLGSSAIGVGDIGCPSCGFLTCRECKQSSHPGELCRESAEDTVVRELAVRERWQTCPGCRSIVELNTGCYHMTCRCRTQFCYICAVRWKNCACPQWDENRLVAAAERRVENQLGADAVARAPVYVLDRMVRDMRDTLQHNHDCFNHNWRFRHGGGQCEECHHHLRDYLLICRNCALLACVRCSRNRL